MTVLSKMAATHFDIIFVITRVRAQKTIEINVSWLQTVNAVVITINIGYTNAYPDLSRCKTIKPLE